MKTVLLIKSLEKDYDKIMLDNLNNSDDVKFLPLYLDKVDISIKSGEIKLEYDNLDFSNISFAYFKSWRRYSAKANVVARYFQLINIKFYDSIVASNIIGMDKLAQMGTLASHSVAIPDTYSFHNYSELSFQDIVERTGLDKFIFKAGEASEGDDNFLVVNKEQWNHILNTYEDLTSFILQSFIPNTFDYRVGIIGNKSAYIRKRSRVNESTHKNNVYLGAKVENISVDKDLGLCGLSEKVSDMFDLEVAGVDVIESLNGERYILEVNPSPSLRNSSIVTDRLREAILNEINNN